MINSISVTQTVQYCLYLGVLAVVFLVCFTLLKILLQQCCNNKYKYYFSNNIALKQCLNNIKFDTNIYDSN